MSNDSRMFVYFSVLVMVFSCVGLGYGLFFFGWVAPSASSDISIPSNAIIIIGIILASINSIASNVLSDQLGEKLKKKPILLKIGIPVTVFLSTLIASILIALLSG